MQKIRKILGAVYEKTLPTNQLTNQTFIIINTDLIGPRWRLSKKSCLRVSFWGAPAHADIIEF